METERFQLQFGSEDWTLEDIYLQVKSICDNNLKENPSKWIFPIEIENNYESPYSIYTRIHIHKNLAVAAKFGNPRAYFHLYYIFLSYFDIEKCQWLMERAENLAKEQQDYVLLSWLVPTTIEKMKFLSNILKDNNGERLYYIAFLHFDHKGYEYLDEAIHQNYKYALIEKGQREPDLEESFKIFINAGDSGIAEGYFYAAQMLEYQQIDSNEYYFDQLYDKAGKLGQMHGYLKLLKMALNCQNYIQATKIADQMSEKGDWTGFKKIGDHFRNKNDELAEKFYVKAGVFTGFSFAHDVNPNKGYQQIAQKYYQIHFENIMRFLK